jgi:peptide/nickel transport system substrate-binding protein
MLEEAGYVDSDADGVREMNDGSGEPLSFRFYYDVSQADHLATAEMISAWLSLIGIDAQVEGLEGSTLTDTLLMGDYDMAMVIWGFDPDPDIMLLTLHTVGVDWEINWSGYSNPEYDALYWDQHYATDYEERRDVIWQMLEIVQEDLPLMQLDVVESFDVFRNDRIRFPVTDTYWSPWLTGVIYNFERVE